MRVLFTFTGGNGHFLPAVPIARAVAAHGHEVAFSSQEAMLEVVERAGFTAIASGGPTLADPATRGPLVAVDRAREEQIIADNFVARTGRERATRLLDVAGDWRPDVIVCDEVDFGAAVAAERFGVPHASIVVLAAGGFIRTNLVAGPLSALRAEHGLPPDPALAMLHRHLTLVPVPASFRDPADPLPAVAQHIRPAVLEPALAAAGDDDGTVAALDWLSNRPGRPTVYFTLGTVFHQESGDLFSRVTAGLGELDANVLVTVGREINPAEVGSRSPNVRVEHFIPQQALLPQCDLVVSHAGSGSVIGALAFGVPLVLLPMGADQPRNGDRCAALGVARVLDPLTVTSADIHDAVAGVLQVPAYREAAARLRDEIAQLPTAEHAATLIEALADGATAAGR